MPHSFPSICNAVSTAAVESDERTRPDVWPPRRVASQTVIHVRSPSRSTSARQPGHAFREGFELADGEVVIGKTVNAAFIGTDLELRLRRLGIDTVVLFGMTADMCVSNHGAWRAGLGYRNAGGCRCLRDCRRKRHTDSAPIASPIWPPCGPPEAPTAD